jgi:anti-anti-sigma regulatory factor
MTNDFPMPRSDARVQFERTGDALQVQIVGPFRFDMHDALEQIYAPNAPRYARYDIDLSQSPMVDSAALGMLLHLREHAGGDDTAIHIRGCCDAVLRVLQVTQFDRIFCIEG